MKQSVKQALEQTAMQIATSAELMAQEINDWQTIQNYISRRIAGITLNAQQQRKLERYQFIYNQLVSGKYKEQEVVEMVQESWRISYPQALKDLRDAKELFTTTINVNKLFEIKAQLERNLIQLQKADESGDTKGYAQLEKNRQKLIAMLPDDESSLADEFIPRTNVFQYDPSLIGVKVDSDEDVWQLIKDLKAKYGGSFTVNGKDVQDAEIIEDGAE
jgi:hypothetical protein